MSTPVRASTPDPLDLSIVSPADLRRRLRQVSVLLGAAERPVPQREAILRRARHHLSGTLRRLDALIAELPPMTLDEQLTERHEGARIEPIP